MEYVDLQRLAIFRREKYQTDRIFCSFEPRRVGAFEENPVARRECSTDPHAVDGPVADFNSEIGKRVGHHDDVRIVLVLLLSTLSSGVGVSTRGLVQTSVGMGSHILSVEYSLAPFS